MADEGKERVMRLAMVVLEMNENAIKVQKTVDDYLEANPQDEDTTELIQGLVKVIVNLQSLISTMHGALMSQEELLDMYRGEIGI